VLQLAPARPPKTPEEAGPRERELLEENARLKRIVAALMDRVETAGVAGGAPYAAFEHAVLLAEQVRERTETLQRTLAELHGAKAQAEAASLSKTRFLAAVSHDLLQPLNAARLFTSALEDHALSESSTRLVGHIGRSLDDVEALLGTLVDMSRLDAGALKPDVAPFPVARLLDVLAEEYRRMAAARGLELRYVGSGAVVSSDLALLARVVRNFLTNAIRYTARGKLLLGCRRRPEGVEILVGDSGPGIPEEQRDAIFQEFRRLGGNRDAADRGLGLGLAIVDRIAKMLDHPLRLTSALGRGSLFSVLVPYGRLPAVAPPPPDALRPGGILARARVWVIDNDPGICTGMAALLGGWGCCVWTATSPAELEGKATGERADVLLVDFHLGEEDPDGLAVAARLRRRQPGLAVVVITANHDARIKGLTRQLGYGCLLKPLKPLRLRMALVDLLTEGSA
jgi:signal transduction histidine kinase